MDIEGFEYALQTHSQIAHTEQLRNLDMPCVWQVHYMRQELPGDTKPLKLTKPIIINSQAG